MLKLIQRLEPIQKRLTTLNPFAQTQRTPADTAAPYLVYQTPDGWEIHNAQNERLHRFTAWYDNCRLMPGGDVELTKGTGADRRLYRFRWDSGSRHYLPDHPEKSEIGEPKTKG